MATPVRFSCHIPAVQELRNVSAILYDTTDYPFGGARRRYGQVLSSKVGVHLEEGT